MRKGFQKTIVLLLKAAISAVLLSLVLHRAGTGNVIKAVGDTGAAYLVLAVCIFVLVIFLNSIRWGLLLGKGPGALELFRLQILGAFFNTFLPGLVGGDAIKAYYLHKMAGKGTEALASIFMTRYLGYAALMFLGLISYPFGLEYFKDTWITWVLPAMVLAFTLGSFVFFGLEIGEKRSAFLSNIYGYFRRYGSQRKIITKSILIGLVVHYLSALMVYVLAAGIGLDVPLATLLVFIPIISTLAALPVTVGGIGIREGAMILLLGTLEVDAGRATALAFLWYFSMAAGGALGITEYMRSKDYIRDAFRQGEIAGNRP